jgi:AraC family transcriptional regulator
MATRLLDEGRLSVAEIANTCGFATQSHMTTVFRRLLGVTPKAYRSYVGSADANCARIGKSFAGI